MSPTLKLAPGTKTGNQILDPRDKFLMSQFPPCSIEMLKTVKRFKVSLTVSYLLVGRFEHLHFSLSPPIPFLRVFQPGLQMALADMRLKYTQNMEDQYVNQGVKCLPGGMLPLEPSISSFSLLFQVFNSSCEGAVPIIPG